MPPPGDDEVLEICIDLVNAVNIAEAVRARSDSVEFELTHPVPVYLNLAMGLDKVLTG